MKKSVYSLVLMEDVVEAIDELAYSLHTSRSNLINQILAERVAMITPQQHVQTIFDSLSQYLKPYTHFQIQSQADDYMYSIKSALKYKYNPTIRYCVYLEQKNGKLAGQLRLVSRTQSEVLYCYLNEFIKLWASIENDNNLIVWQQEEGTKWSRQLSLTAFQEPTKGNKLANCLCQYIQLLDEALKLFFGNIGNQEFQYQQLKEYYLERYTRLDQKI